MASSNNVTDKEPKNRERFLLLENKQLVSKEVLWIWKDVLTIAVGYFSFCLCYYALIYNLHSFVQGRMAFTTLAAVFGAEVAASFFLPTSYVVRRVGSKNFMVLASFGVIIFTIVQFVPDYFYFVPAGILLGVGYTCIWIGLCTYITNVSLRHVELTKSKLPVVFSMFLGIVTVFGTIGGLVGNLVSYIMLKHVDEEELLILQYTDHSICGSNYCSHKLQTIRESHNNASAIQPLQFHELRADSLLILYGVVGCLGPIFVTAFLNERKEMEAQYQPKEETSVCRQLLTNLIAMKEPKLLLLSVAMFNLGLLFSYASGPFARAFITCTVGAHYVSYVAAAHMAFYASVSLIIGLLVRFFGVAAIFVFTSSVSEVAYILMLALNPPEGGALDYSLALSAWMGAAIGIYATLLNTVAGGIMERNKEASFAFYRGWYGLGSTLGFAWASYVCISVMVYTLIGLTLAGTILYLGAEYLVRRSLNVK